MTNRLGSRSLLLPLVMTCLALPVFGQLPAHPRLLFTAQEKSALQARVAVPGSEAAAAFNRFKWSAELAYASSMPNASVQWRYQVYWSLRDLVEVAFRYQMTGNTGLANNAKSTLLTACRELTPTDDKPYRGGSYVISLALAYDMLHEVMSPSERATVVAHLERWIREFESGRNGVGNFRDYHQAVDNHSFSWLSGIVVALLATAEDSTFSDPIGRAQGYMQMIQAGWNDAVSPDGSIDESYGYATYGVCYALYAAHAAERVGLGDFVSGTNITRTGWWFGSSLVGDDWFYFGDSHASHKGTYIDPVIWAAVGRDPGARGARPIEETVWALDRVFALSPPGGSTSCGAISPYLSVALFYPDHVTPRAPRSSSSFFRDNRNEGDSYANKFRAYPGIGTGGQALLHNEVRGDARTLSAFYMIKDEWVSHGHEDDGHFSLAVGGEPVYIDLGYSAGSFQGAQAEAHNIVLCDGVSPFDGSNNNYYRPPTTNARFYGTKEFLQLGATADYVRGSHDHMWQMREASRSVLMVKGSQFPYVVLVDRVDRDGNVRTYRERFHATAGTTGNGTVGNPLRVSRGGRTVRSFWVSPGTVSINRGSTNSTGAITGYPVEAVASGRSVSFVSIHSEFQALGSYALLAPEAGTTGTNMVLPIGEDKILVDENDTGVSDAETASDGRLVWLRREGAANVTGFFAGEASYLSHGSVRLFAASRQVSVAVRAGVLEVSTNGTGSMGLSFVVEMPGIAEVRIDNALVQVERHATGVSFGGSAAPQFHDDDRGYCFTNGFLWDGRPSASARFTAQDRMTSSGGWASLRLNGDRSLGGRPFMLSMDVFPLTAASGSLASLDLGSGLGRGDVTRVIINQSTAGELSASVQIPGTATFGPFPITMRAASGAGRIHALIDPAASEVVLSNAMGVEIGRVTMPAFPQTMFAKALVTEHAEIDDVAVFDSAEDGQTPQGVAFYALPSGQAAFFARTPGLVQLQGIEAVLNGISLDPVFTTAWWFGSNMQEMEITPYLFAAGGNFSQLSTMAWGSGGAAVLAVPGTTAGLVLIKPDGSRLYGEIGF